MINSWLDILNGSSIVESLGWALVHFVWQATVVAVVLALVLALIRQEAARWRYAVSCCGLLALVVAPVVTFLILLQPGPSSRPTAGGHSLAVSPVAPALDWRAVESSGLENGDLAMTIPARPKTGAVPIAGRIPAEMIGRLLPGVVAVWLVGVMLFSIRLGLGFNRIRGWRRQAETITDELSLRIFGRLSKQLAVSESILFLRSRQVDVPVVIGWLKPAIVVPASMLSGFPPLELEAILAHELAHIKRHDFLVNVLQSVAETILFYHPAVWWVSNQIRIEREHCCDDLAVSICGDRFVFARALARMEQRRCGEPALAANGGSLVQRIRRLSGKPAPLTPRWPALVVVLLALAMGAGTLGAALNSDSLSGSGLNGETENTGTRIFASDDDYPMQKSEVKKRDSQTGIEKIVFSNIRLEKNTGDQPRTAGLDMVYSNVMDYTFIPQRVANQLGAVELGEIDFGDQPPPSPFALQQMAALTQQEIEKAMEDATRSRQGGETAREAEAKPGQDQEPAAPAQEAHPEITVSQIAGPVGEGVKVVPYENPRIFVPDHLGFYGMNRTKQHQFKIVRIDRVNLGVGPSFGPVNALVLHNDNSEFGVLGRDWTRRVRGKNGETLWHLATGGFHLMKEPVQKKDPPATQQKPPPPQGSMTVQSTGHTLVDPRGARPDIKVLTTHTYNPSRRSSTGWVKMNGANVPVDKGVEHDGVIVYVTLMFDVVAVDANTRETLWSIDWGKTMPMWQTVSIVDLGQDGHPEIAVELFAARPRQGEIAYRYVNLKDGSDRPDPLEHQDDPSHPESKTGRDAPDSPVLPQVRIDQRNENGITRAFVEAFPQGRTPADLLKHFSMIFDRHGSAERAGSVTNMESIVAADPRYLIEDRMEADRVLFNLPEGSGTRAVFVGDQVELTKKDDHVEVVITNGKLKLIDPVGVARAIASADGGAEQLVVQCRLDRDEVVMTIQTRRLKPDPAIPNPPVQVIMNVDTGAPADEEQPPHGSIRYEVMPPDKDAEKPARMKMKWRYDLKRLAEQAEQDTGKTWEQIVYPEDDPQEPKPDASPPDSDPQLDSERFPWQATGTVSDTNGEPIAGVTVQAHCGFGTLFRTGTTTTDQHGRYDLRFGPGGLSKDPTLVQAATISVQFPGYTEKNLHRQGDLVAALEKPQGEIGWGNKTEADLFLPGKPIEVNFVMVPSSRVRGTIFANSKPAVNYRVALTGDELPPSSNVVDSVRTDDKGRFEFANVPTGFKFQFLVEPPKAEPPWLAWASAPMVFLDGRTEDTYLEFSQDGKPMEFSCQYLQLILMGPGNNWKQALKQAASRQLDLKWNGLATDQMISAGEAWIELGGEK